MTRRAAAFGAFWGKTAEVGASEPLTFAAATNTPGRLTGQVPRNPADIARTAFSSQLSQLELATPNEPKYASRKLHRRMKFRDFDISIETDKGRFRFWHDPHTKTRGKTKMQHPYGYIRRTEGLDGDHVDVFVGPNEQAKYVYVITTNKAPAFKEIDEQKCMLGFDNAEDAKVAFHDHYTDTRFFRSMKAMPYAEFEKKVHATGKGGTKKLAWDPGTVQRDEGLAHPRSRGQDASFTAPTAARESFIGLPDPGPLKHIIDEPMDRMDRIDRGFRFNDLDQHSTAIEGAWGAPSSDTVP